MKRALLILLLSAVALNAQQLGDMLGNSSNAQVANSVKKVDDIAMLQKRVNEGDPLAMLALGTMYASGNKVARDPVKALSLIQSAADKGLGAAQVYLGYIYGEGKLVPRNYELAVKWREEGASKGSADDKWSLGNAYLFGYLVPKDFMKAIYWITQAAQENHINAMLKLVEIYKSLNDAEQLEYWNKKLAKIEIDAAESGNVDAMLSIAKKFMRGKDGFPRNRVQGVFWYKSAADKGNREAMEYVAKLYASGRYLEKNPEKARELFEKIATKYPDFANKIALYYADGKDIPPDPERARYWFEKSLERGNNTNKLQLAFRYWTARGVPRNLERAKRLCLEVAKDSASNKYSGEAQVARMMLSDIAENNVPPDNIAVYFKRR